jgi:YVTN family beta-propeller protein
MMLKKIDGRFFNSSSARLVALVVTLIFIAQSCSDDFSEVNTGGSRFLKGNGVFVINEGNFGNGNGSLSFLSFDSLKIFNDIFYSANNRPPGDVPFSMNFFEDEILLVVNNSAKIEVIAGNDLSSKATISGFTSPRFLLQINNDQAYLSDFYSPEIVMINLTTQQTVGKIPIGRSSEQLVLAGGKVFAAFWSNFGFPGIENNMLMVIDPETNSLTDSVIVGKEPNSMVVDAAGKLWVLCSGGFMAEEFPTLHRINPQLLVTEAVFTFPDIQTSPSSLCINGTGDTLFYLNQGVYQMTTLEMSLPESPFIPQNGRLFYTLGVDPRTSDILVSDAIDYQQRGMVFHYTSKGELKGIYNAGIIPGRFVFN